MRFRMKTIVRQIKELHGFCHMETPEGQKPPAEYFVFQKDGKTFVSEDVYGNGEDEDATESREECFESVEDALKNFMVNGKPLCECGFEVEPIPPPGGIA